MICNLPWTFQQSVATGTWQSQPLVHSNWCFSHRKVPMVFPHLVANEHSREQGAVPRSATRWKLQLSLSCCSHSLRELLVLPCRPVLSFPWALVCCVALWKHQHGLLSSCRTSLSEQEAFEGIPLSKWVILHRMWLHIVLIATSEDLFMQYLWHDWCQLPSQRVF